jgi:hypothetical protein
VPPVFDVGAGGDDFDEEFMGPGDRDGGGVDGGGDGGEGVDDGFEHCGHGEIVSDGGRLGSLTSCGLRAAQYSVVVEGLLANMPEPTLNQPYIYMQD